MKWWQAPSTLDTLEDYLEVPTLSEDLLECYPWSVEDVGSNIDDSFKSDSATVRYEIKVIETNGEQSVVTATTITDYIMEAMDIRDRWVDRGSEVIVNKITTERVNL